MNPSTGTVHRHSYALAGHTADGVGEVRRNVKATRILITSDGNTTLTDVDISRVVRTAPLTQTRTILRTAQHLARKLAFDQTTAGAKGIYARACLAVRCSPARSRSKPASWWHQTSPTRTRRDCPGTSRPASPPPSMPPRPKPPAARMSPPLLVTPPPRRSTPVCCARPLQPRPSDPGQRESRP
jgi:hypothetical protein